MVRRSKPQAAAESTDRGLTSNSLHAQGGGKDGDRDKPNPPSTRIDVKTTQDAKAVAEKRKLSLESRKLDKCPVCDSVHMYERTWTSTQPPVKARLISTQAYLVQPIPGDVLGRENGGYTGQCWMCALLGLGPRGAPVSRGKADEGAQVHSGDQWLGVWRASRKMVPREWRDVGASHSVVAGNTSQSPGLYEVYLSPVRTSPGDAHVQVIRGHDHDRSRIQHELCATQFGGPLV